MQWGASAFKSAQNFVSARTDAPEFSAFQQELLEARLRLAFWSSRNQLAQVFAGRAVVGLGLPFDVLNSSGSEIFIEVIAMVQLARTCHFVPWFARRPSDFAL
jgi:hypothetical protein